MHDFKALNEHRRQMSTAPYFSVACVTSALSETKKK